MSKRKILTIGNPLLKKKSKPVTAITDKIKKVIKDMMDTMYSANGCGLAAIQIGEPLRIILVDTSDKRNELCIMINPKITHKEGEIIFTEGCLSVPGLEGDVLRANKVTVKGKDENFKDIELNVEGYPAVAFQHEIDHLNGNLYIEKALEGTTKSVDAQDNI
ncbi:MAG: peptide deformylase [Candidatus Margulisbacteria bacterium]|nr:peptide deformylase [Candidatus Margulisiibacteriota bacterium]